MAILKKKLDAGHYNLKDQVVAINRVTKVVKGLGFTRLNQIVEREDTPSIRGMVKAIPHLVRIVE